MRINKNLFKEEVLYHIEKGTIPKVVGEEAESVFKWLERHQKEIRDTGVNFICAHAICGKDPLVVVGEGNLPFYLVAIAVTTAISGMSAHNLKKYREQYKNYLENQNDCRK